MRKLCWVLGVGAAVLSTGALTSNASAAPFGKASGMRAAVAAPAAVHQVARHCTHWGYGPWHRFGRCFPRHHRW